MGDVMVGVLAGALLGGLIVLLFMYVLYLRGSNALLTRQVVAKDEQIAIIEGIYRQLAAKCQQLTQAYHIGITDEQSVKMAQIILSKVRAIVESERAGALQKMD